MATKTQLTSDQKTRIVAAIIQLQTGHPTTKEQNPFNLKRYQEVASEIANRNISPTTLRNVLVSLGIEPRSGKKVGTASNTRSAKLTLKSLDDLKNRLSVHGGHLARIEEKLDLFITLLKE